MEGGRQEKVDAGREKFAAYQKRKKKYVRQRDGLRGKDDEACVEVVLSDTSMGGFEESSFVSASEHGNSVVHELRMKVKELEDIISGQQAALEMLQRSNPEQLESHDRLREYMGAVEERNSVIEQLTASLQAALMARHALQQQGDHFAQEVSLLQRQLQATIELVQGHHWDTGVCPDEFIALQNKVLMLEASLGQMEGMKNQLAAKESELEKTAQELRDHKSRSAYEVQRLMAEVEHVQQSAAGAALDHRRKLTELEETFGLQLRMKEEYRRLAEEEKRMLKVAHENELSALRQQYLSTADQLEGKVVGLVNGNDGSADHRELKQQVLRLKLELESSSRKLEETLQVNLGLSEAIGKAQSSFEEELAAVKKQSREESEALLQKVNSVQKQLEDAVSSNRRLCAKLDEESEVHERDVGSLNALLRESYERQQDLTTRLQQLGQVKQLQEESYKQVIESLNQRLKEAAEAEEKTPDVVMAHVESFKADSSRYKEQVDVLNVRLQEFMKTSEAKERLVGDKEAELVVLKGQVDKARATLELVTQSESSLRQQVDILGEQLQEATKYKADAESYKLQNNELNSKLKELNILLSSREQRIGEYEKMVAALNSKLQELEDFRAQAEMYKEKIRKLIVEAEELLVYKDKAVTLQLEIDNLNGSLNAALKMFSEVTEVVVNSAQHRATKREVESEIPLNQLEQLKEKLKEVLNSREKEASCFQMQIADLNARLAGSAQAAEKQACEWEGRIAFYRDRLESLGSQVCVVEEGQRTEVSRLQDSHQLELRTLKASLKEEMAALSNELATQKVHHDEELEQCKSAFDVEMVRLKEAHNMKLVELDETYKSQLALDTQQIQSLEIKVKDLSLAAEEKCAELGSIQEQLKLLKEYEEKIRDVEERNQAEWSRDSSELELCRQQIEVLKRRLEEASLSEQKHIEMVAVCQMQVDSYKQQVELLDSRCVDELAASQREIQELRDKLASSCVVEHELEQVKEQLAARYEEAASLRSQVRSLTVTLEETVAREESLQEKLLDLQKSRESYVAEVEGLTARLDDNLTEMDVLQEKLNLLQQEANTIESLSNQTCTKCELHSSVELELTKFKDESEQLKKSLIEGKAREECLNADLAKCRCDVAELNGKIHQLEEEVVELQARVEDLTVDKLKLESLLTGQQELISDLQQHGGEHLADVQEMVVHRLKTDGLMAAQDELQAAFRHRVVELEQALEKVNHDNSQLTLKVVKAKELLKRLKEEKNKASARSSDLEAECERLRAETDESRKQQEDLSARLKSSVDEASSTKSLYDQLLLNNSMTEQRLQDRDKEVGELLAKSETMKEQWREQEVTLSSLRMEVKACEELQAALQKRLVDQLGGDNVVETLVLELGGQTKEVVVLKERLKLLECRCEASTAVKVKYEHELSEMWKVHKDMEDALGKTTEQLEKVSRVSKVPVLEVLEVLEDPVLEFSKDLQQEKLLEPAGEREEEYAPSWDDVLSNYERELLGQLAAYREQHAGLAELLGSSGILQETMYQQKQQLLKKLQEKMCVDHRLEEQRALYRDAQSRLQAMEQQVLEKDNVHKELARQKRLLMQDLREIEDRLRNQESALHTQRLALEAEVRARDLRIAHWQLQARAVQASSAVDGTQEERLRDVRAQLDSAHTQAIERLRTHFQEQLVVREGVLRSIPRIPGEQILSVVELISCELQRHRSHSGAIGADEEDDKLAESVATAIVHKLENELEAAVASQLSTPDMQQVIQIKECEMEVVDSCGSVLRAVEDSLSREHYAALKGVMRAWRQRYEEELTAVVSALMETWVQEETAQSSGEMDTVANCQSKAESLLSTQEQLVSALEGVGAELVRFHRGSVARLQDEMQSQHDSVLQRVDQIRTAVSSLQSQLEHASRVSVLHSDVEELRLELEAKHAKEVEELRQYFEQKCADVEKRYSEEVFSQHSRKLSGSSGGSAEELSTDMYFAGGDHGQRVPALTHICDSYSVEPSYKDLDEHYRADYERRLLEYRDQLEAVKVSLEQKYSSEMTALRDHYEQLLGQAQHQLKDGDVHQSDDGFVKQHERKVDDVEEYFTENIIDELARMSSEAAIDKVCLEARMQGEIHKELDNRRSGMVDACTETQEKQYITDSAATTENMYTSRELNFTSVLESLKTRATGTALAGCVDQLAALHEEDVKTLRSAVQDQAGMFEVEHEAWERRLHERVEQARCDVVATLHHHLQALISDSDKSPGAVPQEVAALQERFVGPLQREVDSLKQELAALKAQEEKQPLLAQDDSQATVEDLIKEREEQRCALGVLRCVVRELLDYCARCEHELNSTLVEELSPADRVHLSPDTTALVSFVQDDSLPVDTSTISTQFRSELNRCLVRLHSEASSLLLLSRSLAGAKELVGEGLCELVQPARRLQLKDPARRSVSEPSSPPLKLLDEIREERDRIWEEARREKEDLQLQVRVHTSLGASSDHQVEAADKQLRSTRQFLEEQATEREQEREEFAREVAALQEQLRDRERDCVEHKHLLKEVESLDQQLKESAAHLADSDTTRTRIQADLDTAAEKISTLREIIVELEVSVETRAANEESLKQQLAALESLLHQQDESHRQLANELESLREESGRVQLAEHISALEEQLCRHRLHVEQFQSGSGAVRRMKTQIQELEAAVGRKARELESLHCVVPSNSSPVSSPLSEDISIREQLEVMRCSTPDRCQRETPSPVPLPLEELQRLQDKLQRLCRAEESALKRVADLEMELCSLHHREEEVAAERDVLQRQTEEQLLKISSLQARLDEQRRAVDSAHWLAISELRSELLERTDEIHSLRDACDASHKEVKELRQLLEQARQQAAVQESEMMSLLERLQSSSQQYQPTTSQERAGSVMDALLADAREEQSSLQDELASIRTRYKQLQWLLSCYESLHLTPQLKQQLSALLHAGGPGADAHPDKQLVHLDPHHTLLAEEVFREAPELSSSYSLPDTLHERTARSVAEVQLDTTDAHKQLQHVEQENRELARQVAELQAERAAGENVQAENSSLAQEVEALGAKCSAVHQEKLLLEQQVEDLTARCSSIVGLQQEKLLLLQDTETLQRENMVLAKQVEELQLKCRVVGPLREENASLVETVEHLKHQCSSLQSAREENSELSQQIEVIRTECMGLRNLEKDKNSLVEKINSLEAKCSLVERLEEENLSQVQKIVELQELCSVTNSLKEENVALSQKVAELQDVSLSMKKLQEENECVSREVKDLREQCSVTKSLQLENVSLTEKIKELEGQCSIVGSLQEENRLLSQKVGELQDECSVVKNLQEERLCLSQKLENLQIDSSFLRNLQQENLSLCRRVKELQAECSVLKDVHQENAALTQKMAELEDLRKENTVLSQQVHELSLKYRLPQPEDDRQDQEHNIVKLQEEKRVLQEAYLKMLQDMENKQGSLDELSGQLQRELEESEKLDLSLLERLTSSDEDVPAGDVLEPSLGIILKKILASGISVLTFPELSLLHQHVCSATVSVVTQDGPRQPHTLICDSLDAGARTRVSELEALLGKERQLASELHSTLGSERLHAQELANHVRLQSQLLADMQLQQTSIQSTIGRYTDLLEMERNKTLCLEEKLASERSSCRQLQAALEAERQKMRSLRIQDCSLLESLRQQLDVALESEDKLRHQLQQGSHNTDRVLQVRCVELEVRVAQLEEQLSQEREAAQAYRLGTTDVHARQADLEQSPTVVLDQLQSLVDDSVDDGGAELRQRIVGVKERLQELSTAQVPHALEERLAPLRQREQQLLEELGAAQRQAGELRTALVVRNQRLATAKDQLAALEQELAASRSRESELQRRLGPDGLQAGGGTDAVNVNASHDREVEWLRGQIKLLQEREKANRAVWLDQKVALEEALQAAHVNHDEPPQSATDLEERMTHLFGKYLRSESYRKSLVWQKRYLLVALGGYQDCHATTLGQLALMAGHVPGQARSSPRRKLRVAVIAVIVIQRMHYLVRRWRHGRRIGRSVIVGHPVCECTRLGSQLSYHGEHVSHSKSPSSRDEVAPWHSSGRPRPWRLGDNGCVTVLEPSALPQYSQRCNNIQRRLGLASTT